MRQPDEWEEMSSGMIILWALGTVVLWILCIGGALVLGMWLR